MKNIAMFAAFLLALSVPPAPAQQAPAAPTSQVQQGPMSPLSYDPFIVLPGSQGGMGIDVGLAAADAGSLTDVGDVYVAGKYDISDRLEIGARLTTGMLDDRRDGFSDVVLGAKYGLGPSSALTVNTTVYNEIDEFGISLGYMQTMRMGGTDVNSFIQIGMLDGYARKGVGLDMDIQPRFDLSEQLIGYLDILFRTNTDAFGDNLALDLWPNLDFVISDALIVNGGITFGLAGDMKQDDLGIHAVAVYLLR